MVNKIKLTTFFSYYGSKFRLSKVYPKPLHKTIIEPFAGSAGYGIRYYWHNVILYDINPIIVGVWDYLIRTPSKEIIKLPIDFNHIDEVKDKLSQEVIWLIGFWLNTGNAVPCKRPSTWMKSKIRPNGFWGQSVRLKLAFQVEHIRHWKIKHGTYENIKNRKATWFVDPPYDSPSGKKYVYSSVNYKDLSEWCKNRKGQTIVCEMEDANWLPFEFLTTAMNINTVKCGRKYNEMMWTKHT